MKIPGRGCSTSISGLEPSVWLRGRKIVRAFPCGQSPRSVPGPCHYPLRCRRSPVGWRWKVRDTRKGLLHFDIGVGAISMVEGKEDRSVVVFLVVGYCTVCVAVAVLLFRVAKARGQFLGRVTIHSVVGAGRGCSTSISGLEPSVWLRGRKIVRWWCSSSSEGVCTVCVAVAVLLFRVAKARGQFLGRVTIHSVVGE
jgi:hypothetical protein